VQSLEDLYWKSPELTSAILQSEHRAAIAGDREWLAGIDRLPKSQGIVRKINSSQGRKLCLGRQVFRHDILHRHPIQSGRQKKAEKSSYHEHGCHHESISPQDSLCEVPGNDGGAGRLTGCSRPETIIEFDS
jgi:hypothetical protein